MTSSTIPPVGCMFLTTILYTCTSSLPITTPLSPVTWAIRKPKNLLNDSIIGPGWPQTFTLMLLDVTTALALKVATQSPPALLYHFSQA